MSPFEPELAKLRFWNRLGMGALACGVPAMIVLTLNARDIALAPPLVAIVFGAVVVALFTARFKIWAFLCPACGLPFNRKHALAAQGRGRQCVHCGLAAYKD